MPYIITTYDRHDVYGTPNAVVVKNRRPVATLDEANDATLDARRVEYHPPGSPYRAGQPNRLGPDGGTVGPLPDGTIIEVKFVTWVDLNGGQPSMTTAVAAGEGEWPEAHVALARETILSHYCAQLQEEDDALARELES